MYKPLGADSADGTALLLLALWGKLLKRPIEITVNFNLDSVNNNPLFVSSNNTLAVNNNTNNNNSLLSVSNDNILAVNNSGNKNVSFCSISNTIKNYMLCVDNSSNNNRLRSVVSATILKTTVILSTTVATTYFLLIRVPYQFSPLLWLGLLPQVHQQVAPPPWHWHLPCRLGSPQHLV